jgi:hypothetical protein
MASVLLVSLGVHGASAASSSNSPPLAVRLAIPIDADAPGVWSQAVAGAPLVGIIILNPSDGPGASPDANYAQQVANAQANGIRVLGYVYTQWANGNVSVQEAEGWIDRYYSWYHVDGIMLDEANDTCATAPLHFYGTLYSYIKAEPGPAMVLLNPGTATDECYAAISDVLLTFENDYSMYVAGYEVSDWTARLPPSHFFHIVFDVPTVDDMRNVVATAVERGAGWVYVTNLNDSNGNPYSSLPYYFNQELAYVGQLDDTRQADPAATPAATPMLLILGLTAAGSAFVLVVVGRRRSATSTRS